MAVSLSSNGSVMITSADNTPWQLPRHDAAEDGTAHAVVSSSTESHKCSRSSSRGVGASIPSIPGRGGQAILIPLSARDLMSESSSPERQGSAAFSSPSKKSRHFPIPLVSTPSKRASVTSRTVKPHPMLPPDQVQALQGGSPSASLYSHGGQRSSTLAPIARVGSARRQVVPASTPGPPHPSRDGARAAHTYRVPPVVTGNDRHPSSL
jgi:hypothetical protein